MKKTLIAMILVGGKGTRLKEITKDTAKPAVSFGAKYRLIDFTLSNLTNSDIDVVGLVTQYEPYELMGYIGRGASWDLDRLDGGLFFLTPYAKNGDVMWQKGTAHAISQYFSFVKEYEANYVLILSGDQIYKMNYREMLKHHLTHNAMITIAATRVPLKEASRFGIVEVNQEGLATGFEEKPAHPKSTLASMGLYIFNTKVLEQVLSGSDSEDSIDFGKNIIPRSIRDGLRVSVYEYDGYWRDVGTVESLYDANMDMLDDPQFLNLNVSKDLPVYSKSLNLPPHIVTDSGSVQNSIVADGSLIEGNVRHSVLSYQSHILPGALVTDAVLLPGVTVGENAVLRNCVVNKNVSVPPGFHYECKSVDILDQTDCPMTEVRHE